MRLPILTAIFIASLAMVFGCTHNSATELPTLHISSDSVYRLMTRLGFDEIDTTRDSNHPRHIKAIGFDNALMPSINMKGDAFFSFDKNGQDTAFGWVYVGIEEVNGKKRWGNLEAGFDGFKKLVSALRKEYGPPDDSVLVGSFLKDIVVHWKSAGYNTEVIYSIDTGFPGLEIRSHLSPWELPKPDTNSQTAHINYNAAPATPLVQAILSHDRDEVKRLLDSGANPNEFSSNGTSDRGKSFFISTPLSLAVSNKELCDTQILKLLIEYGANPNLTTGSKNFMFNPLNSAIESACPECVEFLLRHGANPNAFDGLGRRTSLFIAILTRHTHDGKWANTFENGKFADTSQAYLWSIHDTIIASLLKYAASPTLADPNGFTPLHAAAMYCDSSIAEELIAQGASLTAKDKDGETPEDLAKKAGCTSVLAVFRKHDK